MAELERRGALQPQKGGVYTLHQDEIPKKPSPIKKSIVKEKILVEE